MLQLNFLLIIIKITSHLFILKFYIYICKKLAENEKINDVDNGSCNDGIILCANCR